MRILSFSTLFIVLGIIFGWASAVQSLNGAGLQIVKDGNGWQEWQVGPSDRLLPYSLGHFISSGQLPPPKSVRYFERFTDDEGNTLRGDCMFLIEGPVTPSRWWSMTAGTTAQAALSAGAAILESDNLLKITASRLPVPGNWIAPDDTGGFHLTYVLSEVSADSAIEFPHVKKLGC
jgi:hypothetical protein